MRIGFGYDSHRFEEGRALRLGGVEIPGCCGLKGHSDADVLLHAVSDAVLGAAALGDIGEHFPDTDERWRGADSALMLRQVVSMAKAAGFSVGNVDVCVICEKPRLRPYVASIRESLARLLEVGISQVSVKGKTNEKMDDVGAEIGMEVHAVILLKEEQGEK